MTELPGDQERSDVPPRPWSFWLLIVLTALYLGWRAVQGVVWVFDRLAG